jgi:hypothetical protein
VVVENQVIFYFPNNTFYTFFAFDVFYIFLHLILFLFLFFLSIASPSKKIASSSQVASANLDDANLDEIIESRLNPRFDSFSQYLLQELDKRLNIRYPEDPSASTDKPSKRPVTDQSSSVVGRKIARVDSSNVNRPITRSEKKAALEQKERESRRAAIALAHHKLRMDADANRKRQAAGVAAQGTEKAVVPTAHSAEQSNESNAGDGSTTVHRNKKKHLVDLCEDHDDSTVSGDHEDIGHDNELLPNVEVEHEDDVPEVDTNNGMDQSGTDKDVLENVSSSLTYLLFFVSYSFKYILYFFVVLH